MKDDHKIQRFRATNVERQERRRKEIFPASLFRRGEARRAKAGLAAPDPAFSRPILATMELRPWIALLVALTAIVAPAQALLLTVQNTECVWEDVEYDGDIITGNFVVLDHEIFWGADHPGIELVVGESLTVLSLYIFLTMCIDGALSVSLPWACIRGASMS